MLLGTRCSPMRSTIVVGTSGNHVTAWNTTNRNATTLNAMQAGEPSMAANAAYASGPAPTARTCSSVRMAKAPTKRHVNSRTMNLKYARRSSHHQNDIGRWYNLRPAAGSCAALLTSSPTAAART